MIIKLLYFYLLYENKTIMENLTLNTFKEKIMDYEKNPDNWVFEGKIPAIIDFYASWCGPCKMMSPILDELSNEYKGKIDIYKVNTEEEQELSAMFGIRSIPTLLFIPLNDIPQLSQGALPKNALIDVINDILLKNKEL